MGEGFIDSAKNTSEAILDNLPLFIIVEYFNNFLNYFSFIFITLLPAFIGGGIIYKAQVLQNNPTPYTYAVYGGIIIALLATLITSVIIGVLNQSLSSIYLFYCLDKKFRAMGMNATNIPQ